MKYVLIATWTAHEVKDMEKEEVTFEEAKGKLEAFWENEDDSWEDTFDSYEDYQGHLQRIRTCTDREDLDSMLDGIGYWLSDKESYNDWTWK